jgi:hypothetical protein
MRDYREAGKPPLELKISLLFGIGNDLDNLGLRYYFEQVDDKIIINIPGIEQKIRWGIGITGLTDPDRNINANQINTLINYALENTKFKGTRYKITTLAAYSAGYIGLNQTVNEGMIPLNDVETVVYYDCIYRSDKPQPALDDDNPPKSLTKVEKMHLNCIDELKESSSGSAYNTRRALTRIAEKSTNDVKFVGYMSTPAGSPTYPSVSRINEYTVDFPIKIDLRCPECQNALFAISITRCLHYAQIDGQINSTQVPSEFKSLETDLPRRGKLASTELTCRPKPGFIPEKTLLGYWTAHKEQIGKALQKDPMSKAFHLISTNELIYTKNPGDNFSYPPPNNQMGMLHFALIPEFGWEFLL